MRLWYRDHRFSSDARAMIGRANQIIDAYQAQGFDLTLRQLYYQFVSRGYLANKDSEYKRLGTVISDARMAGLIDWDAIVDRTRNLRSLSHWNHPSDIVRSAARSFALDRWTDQDNYVEVWIEKDALLGVIEGVCNRLDVPYFSCRGYTSQSEMWGASQRLLRQINAGKHVTIVHLGDHDPSGIDMSRDIAERLERFLLVDTLRNGETGARVDQAFQLRRIALLWDQVQQYNPPPNPTKITDTRSGRYIDEWGRESWELDALEPTVLAALITEEVESYIDGTRWEAIAAQEAEQRKVLTAMSAHYADIRSFMSERGWL